MTQPYQSTGQNTQQSQRQSGQQQTQQQFTPSHFDEALKSEYRTTLEDLSWLRKQSRWASMKAHQEYPGSGIESTLEDVAEIAELNEELILTSSPFAETHIDTFVTVATQTMDQLQQFSQDPAIEAVISDLARAVSSANELLAMSQGQQFSQSQGQQSGVQSQFSGTTQQGTTQSKTQLQQSPTSSQQNVTSGQY